MKKLVINISLTFIIIAAGFMVFLGLRLVGGNGAVPSYRFLEGRNPITCKKADKGIEDKRYTYSFEADFNDLCSKADAELIPAGFSAKSVVQILSCNEYRERVYWLKERFPRSHVWIRIMNNQPSIKLPHSISYAISPKDGWIMIEIVYYQGWRWPF